MSMPNIESNKRVTVPWGLLPSKGCSSEHGPNMRLCQTIVTNIQSGDIFVHVHQSYYYLLIKCLHQVDHKTSVNTTL